MMKIIVSCSPTHKHQSDSCCLTYPFLHTVHRSRGLHISASREQWELGALLRGTSALDLLVLRFKLATLWL